MASYVSKYTGQQIDEAVGKALNGLPGGGSGNGTVTSVNGVEPDGNGNVVIPIPSKPGDIGAEVSGTATAKVSAHNQDEQAHTDIRELISGLSQRLNGIADSDDTTLDQLSEIVAYIKSNKSLIDSITTGKVSVSDIVNNLTSTATNKPLSAAQGKALKALIDAIVVPTKVSQLTNDAGYLTEHQDISGKLDANRLPEAINTALEQAKDSGEFDGEPGSSGVHVGSEPPTGGQNVWIDPTGEPDGEVSGGVQSDWNQTDETAPDFIRNKPFGESIGGSDTLTIRVMTSEELNELYASGQIIGEEFLKISNSVVKMSDLANGYSMGLSENKTEYPPGSGEETGSICAFADSAFLSVYHNGAEFNNATFPEKGLYINAMILMMFEQYGIESFSLVVPGFNFAGTNKIDEKYLPSTVVLYADSIYLYRDGNVTDENNRITKSEFLKYLDSPVPLKIADSQSGILRYFLPLMVSINNTQPYATVVVADKFLFELRTAEYVPE